MKIFRGIGWKLYFRIGLVTIIVFLAVAFILISNNKHRLQEEVSFQAINFTQFATNPIISNYQLYFPSGYLKFREQILKILELSPYVKRIQILDLQGNILVDSDALKEAVLWQYYHQKENQIPQEVLEKIIYPEPFYVFDPKNKNRILEIYYPFIDEWGKYRFTVRYFLSYEEVDKEINNLIKKTLFFTLAGFFTTILVLNLIIKRIVVDPLNEFKKGIHQIIEGNFDKRIKLPTHDEIEELANTFNQMIEKIIQYQEEIKESRDILEIKVRARTRELQELADNLEIQVQERTKDLQNKIRELERFHKLTVGRELKMIELKKEIKRLKEELAKKREN